jgi:hypothetical protein
VPTNTNPIVAIVQPGYASTNKAIDATDWLGRHNPQCACPSGFAAEHLLTKQTKLDKKQ